MEGTPRDAAEAPRDAERPKREAPPKDAAAREQTFSLEITSLAAVATAWSAFQASTWSGVQTFALADSRGYVSSRPKRASKAINRCTWTRISSSPTRARSLSIEKTSRRSFAIAFLRA